MNCKKFFLTGGIVVLFAWQNAGAQDLLFNKAGIKSTMLRVAKWQMDHANSKPLNTWTNGAFYTGVFATYQLTREQWLLDSLAAIGERYQWLPGKRFDHADDIAITQTYADLYRLRKDPRFLQASIDSIQKMMHVPGEEAKKKGITWWWCDALFMAPPAMAKLAAITRDPAYLVTCDTLFRQCYRLLYNQEEHLFARDASYLWDNAGNGKKESNGKKLFWGRGNGWVIAGLAKLLEEMPAKYQGRDFYTTLFKQMAERLAGLQQPDGLWRTSLLDPGAYPGGEASGSGFICYALTWGVNNKILDRNTYLPVIKKCWGSLSALVNEEGRVGWVQPIGADPRRNFSENSWEAYGSGAFLLAAAEIVKGKTR